MQPACDSIYVTSRGCLDGTMAVHRRYNGLVQSMSLTEVGGLLGGKNPGTVEKSTHLRRAHGGLLASWLVCLLVRG